MLANSGEGEGMAKQSEPFEADHRPECGQCGLGMWMLSRARTPALGNGHEVRTFECPACGHRHVVTVAPTHKS